MVFEVSHKSERFGEVTLAGSHAQKALEAQEASERSVASASDAAASALASEAGLCYEPLLRAVYERGPVAVSVAARTWQLGGKVGPCELDAVIDHAVTLIGFGRDEKLLGLGIHFLTPKEEASGWMAWMPSFFSSPLALSSGGICTQSLLAVLKANTAQRGWRSLDMGSLHRQIGSLLNRQQESAGVIIRASSPLDHRTLGSIWTTAEVRRALLVGLCYKGSDLQLKGSWNDIEDMKTWLQSEQIFAESEIRSLTDQTNGNGSDGSNFSVSREQILSNLRWLLVGDGPGSATQPAQLLFHFSGHGDGKKLLANEGESETISDSELCQMISDLLQRDATLTCIFDCCDGTKFLESLLWRPECTLAFGTRL
eukprot:Skav210064  [mRNA]  locus=scaffold485:81662:100969:+ [translate_table: standard]